MRLTLLSIVLSLWVSGVAGDAGDPVLPALYDVNGVEPDDTLNIRSGPDPRAAVIGRFPHDENNIEVIALSRAGRWALINTDERSGWVASRYLAPQLQSSTKLGIPNGLRCFGTEPFWDIAFLDQPRLIYSTPDSETEHPILSKSPSLGSGRIAETGMRFQWQSRTGDVTSVILPGYCSDGMSDRQYGLHYVDDQGLRLGCCSLN